jgi:hypothetical protein
MNPLSLINSSLELSLINLSLEIAIERRYLIMT